MRILNLEDKTTLDSLSVLLTKNEAIQLIGYLEGLFKNLHINIHIFLVMTTKRRLLFGCMMMKILINYLTK